MSSSLTRTNVILIFKLDLTIYSCIQKHNTHVPNIVRCKINKLIRLNVCCHAHTTVKMINGDNKRYTPRYAAVCRAEGGH